MIARHSIIFTQQRHSSTCYHRRGCKILACILDRPQLVGRTERWHHTATANLSPKSQRATRAPRPRTPNSARRQPQAPPR